MNSEFHKSFLKKAKGIYKPIETLEIYTWAERNCYLPPSYAKSGRFSVDSSRYLIEPLKAIKDLDTRKVVLRKAIQSAGTLAAELAIAWYIANRPMPIQFSMLTEQMIGEELYDRLYPLFLNCKALKNITPTNEREMTKRGMRFPNCTLYCNSERESAFQAKSIGFEICDEVHLWDRGKLKLAEARLTAYEEKNISKLLIVSQAGRENDDFDNYFKAGTQELWNVPCLGCGKYFAPQFYAQREDGTNYGLIFDTNSKTYDEDKGVYIKHEAIATIRYECEYCGHKHTDSKELKEKWNREGKYIQTNPHGTIKNRSFHWNALITRDWDLLLDEYLEARALQQKGIYQNIQDFYKQRICKPQSEIEENFVKQHIKTQHYDIQSDWSEAVARIATIDVQKNHYWLLVREWSAIGDSRMIFYGKVRTENDLLQLLNQWKVQPNCTYVDVGFTEDGATWEFIDRNRFIGLKGTGYLDDKPATWDIRGKKYLLYFDKPKPIPHGKNGSIWFPFAANTIRDIVANLRDSKSDRSFKCLDILDYKQQIFGEKKQPIKTKYGDIIWKWVKKGENHSWDCEVMQVVATLINDSIFLIEKPYLSTNQQMINPQRVPSDNLVVMS